MGIKIALAEPGFNSQVASDAVVCRCHDVKARTRELLLFADDSLTIPSWDPIAMPRDS